MSQRYSYVYFLSFQKVENSQERHDRIIRWYENMHSESLCALSRLGRISEFTSRRLKRQLQQILTKKLQNFIYVFFGSSSVQHISPTQKDHSFSAPEIPQFHTKNPSVQHNPLSSTPKTPQFSVLN